MSEKARELTKAEEQAVKRVERALAGVPDTLALFFNESGCTVFDSKVWADRSEWSGSWVDENSSASFPINCRYDTGAL